MAKLNIPTGGEEGGSKKKFVLPGGGAGAAKGKLVVPGGDEGVVPPVEPEASGAVPGASEFGEVEPSAGDDFLILEEAPVETADEPVQVAAMAAPEPEASVEEPVEPERAEEVKPVRISSMAPPPAEDELVAEEAADEVVYEEPAAVAEPIMVPAAGEPKLVVPPVVGAPPVAQHVPQQAYAPPAQQPYGQPAAGPQGGYGPPPMGAMPPGAVPGMEGQTTLLQQSGYQPSPQRMVPGWALMLVGILLGMVITILAVKFSPLGEMLVGPVMTVEELGYEE